ncbi:hypothetical protein [Asticcacaulis sp.]|uniref:hypothetical protein n=1 Tax=Asticcacaulis sp. TaxID=1872648 RepID=UPI002BF47C24|nr:hypothetical protein [Asticcacaulis sp.]HTM79780.1 hypothetical protein [Asticcacaulis sp.]
MNDAGLDKLSDDVFKRIAPLIEGKPNVAVLVALTDVMIRVANNGQTGKTRQDALRLISTVTAIAAGRPG